MAHFNFLKWVKTNRESIGILLFFGLLAVIYWYPLPFFLRSKQLESPIIDPAFNEWIIGWGIHALTHYPWRFFEANMYYPLTHTLAWGDNLFAITLMALPLKPFFGLVGAHNLLTILSSAFSGFTMYLFIRYLVKQPAAAVIGGIMWAFSFSRMLESTHIQILSTQWIPLVFLFAEKIRREHKKSDVLWLAVFVFLLLATNYYLSVFTIVSFFIYYFVLIITGNVTLRAVGRTAMAWIIGAIMAMPLYLPSILIQLRDPIERGFTNLSAMALHGILPWPPTGKLIRHTLEALGGTPITQDPKWQTIGLVTAVLLLIGLIRLVVEWRQWRTNAIYFAFLLIGIIAILGAVGPLIFWYDKTLTDYNPIHNFFYDVIPGYKVLRIPSRWIILSLFGLAIFASWASVMIFNRFKPNLQGLIVVLFTFWVIFEQFPMPRKLYPNFSYADYPVYAWLRQQKGEFPILELPIYPGISNHANDIVEARRMYFSTFHWKKRVNGAISPYVPNAYVWNAELVNALGDDPKAMQFLLEHHIKYVLFFPDDVITLRESEKQAIKLQQRLDNDSGLAKVQTFPEASVYRVKGVE